MSTATMEKKQPVPSLGATDPDKRYFPRWEVNKSVDYSENGEAAIWSYTKDLTLDGTSIIVPGDPPVRHYVQLIIHLSSTDHFKARGRVVWRKSEPTRTLIGIIFINLSPKAHALITRCAFEL